MASLGLLWLPVLLLRRARLSIVSALVCMVLKYHKQAHSPGFRTRMPSEGPL